jgi:hypothetical protein
MKQPKKKKKRARKKTKRKKQKQAVRVSSVRRAQLFPKFQKF